MLYPLSYEGEMSRMARIPGLSGVLGRSITLSDVRLGRTITSIHRSCEASEAISDRCASRSRVICAEE